MADSGDARRRRRTGRDRALAGARRRARRGGVLPPGPRRRLGDRRTRVRADHPHFALFIVEGLTAEAFFLALPRARPLTLGLGSGSGIGTFGLAAEWAWTNVWMPIPWNADLLPEGAVLGLLAAVAGSLVGAWVGERLASDELPRFATPAMARSPARLRLRHRRLRALKPAQEGVTPG